MRNYIFLILILDFLKIINSFICSNVTEDDSLHVCSYKLLRRKRSPEEYTRWRADVESSSEFVVKVLDEDIPPKTKGVVAVNIQPPVVTDRIIIGGAIIPTTPKDYTRFVPPTTAAVTKIDDMFLAPVTPSKFEPLLQADANTAVVPYPPRNKPHPLRDESPPAGPHFISRSSVADMRQFAPIAPVTFTPRRTHYPVTRTTTCTHNMLYMNQPTRTTTVTPTTFEIVTRTTEEIRQIGDPSFSKNINIMALKNFLMPSYPHSSPPERTTPKDKNLFTKVFFTDDDFELLHTTNLNSAATAVDKSNEDLRRSQDSSQSKQTEKLVVFGGGSGGGRGGGGGGSDFESYNNLFYMEESDEGSSKAVMDTNNFYDMRGHDDHPKTPKPPKNNTKESDQTTSMSYFDEINYDSHHKNTTPASSDVKMPAASMRTKIENNEFFKDVMEKTTELKDINVEGEKRASVRSKNCSVIKLRPIGFNCPMTLPEIEKQLKLWADTSPIAKLVDITYNNLTTMENPIYMMIVDDPSNGQILSAKETVLIIAGIHGRDHYAVTAAMYVLYQLLDRGDVHADLLVKYRFWILPVFNPDGYDFSVTFPHRREWMKNLRQNWVKCKNDDACKLCFPNGLRCTVEQCFGVNLDRNFEYQWIPPNELDSEHPCGDLYAGRRQLSEIETQAITSYLHELRIPVNTFVAFKEGAVLGILYPYSHTKKKRAFDSVYRHKAMQAATAAYSISGRPYVAGQASEYLPLYAGGIEDWMDGHLGIDNTYTIMMYRPTDVYSSTLMTERVVHEAYAALDTLLLLKTERLPQREGPSVFRMEGSASRGHPSILCLLLTVLVLSIRHLT